MATLPLSLVKLHVADAVATITVNRPEVLNRINPAVLHQLQQAFDHAVTDSNVHGIVLGGEGKVFMVGADIDFFIRNIEAREFERIVKFTEAGHNLLNVIDRSPKPVVARVHGATTGAGFEFALACDHIVAAENTIFSFPETGLGIYPGLGGTQRTARAIGAGQAKWLIFTGKLLNAAEALKIGLVDAVVPEERLHEVSRGLALARGASRQPSGVPPEYAPIARFFERSRADPMRAGTADAGNNPVLIRALKSIAGKAPIALRLAERIIEDGLRGTLEAGLRLELDPIAEIFATQDAYLGLTFRAQKRFGKPTFRGQ